MEHTSIEVYMELDFVKELDQETQDNIRKIRTEYEPMTNEQFQFLFQQGVIKRTQKLKSKKRSLFVCPEGRIWTFNFYTKQFTYVGYFNDQDAE